MRTIERLDAKGIEAEAEALSALLKDAVDGDAGLGFLPPLAPEEARAYWRGEVVPAVAAGSRVVVVAREEGRVVGSAQLDLCRRPNGRHRAEVTKVMVRSDARRRGHGLALMRALDAEARREGRTLLHLDTYEGADAERLYLAAGYVRSGAIPAFARRGDGSLGTTVIYHRLL